jgi:hypothetical protein
MKLKNTILGFILLGLTACQMAAQPVSNDIKFLNKYPIKASNDYKRIPICYGIGCKEKATIKLSDAQWGQVKALFAKVDGPKTERSAVAKAISKLEQFTGKQTPTYQDKGRNDQGGDLPGQKDCVDETINTTTYLLLLQERKLLKRHVVYYPAFRNDFLMVGSHYTAVIQYKKSGEFFAVDSWFEDNGGETHIVPLAEWNAGWRPKSAKR